MPVSYMEILVWGSIVTQVAHRVSSLPVAEEVYQPALAV